MQNRMKCTSECRREEEPIIRRNKKRNKAEGMEVGME
jgi:hypothetical protein